MPSRLFPPEEVTPKTRRDGIREIAQSGVRRLLELGLPEQHALVARDVIIAHIENYSDRLLEGEWKTT